MMTSLGFIKKHYKAFLLFLGTCIVLSSFGLNAIVIPWYDKQYGMKSKSIQAVGDNIPKPYIWWTAPPDSFGIDKTKDVNVTFYRNWLNTTVVWSLQKSTDNSHWIDCTKTLEIKKDWNRINLSEKHTLTWVADEDAYYQLLLKTDNVKTYQDLSNSKDAKSDRMLLNFSITATEDYNIYYDWSDYSKSAEASKTTMSKEVTTASNKQQFSWNVYTSQKLAKGDKFNIDPIFGYTTHGIDSQVDLGQNGAYGCSFLCPATGKLKSITAYEENYHAITTFKYQCAVYLNSTKALLGTTEAKSIPAFADGWFVFNFSTPIDVTASTYYLLAVDTNATNGNIYLGYTNTVGVYSARDTTANVITFHNPFSVTSSSLVRIYSIYGTYTRTPTQTGASPTNGSTGIALTPKCNITVSDPDGDAMTVRFYENSTGSWVLRQTNSSVANGTYRWTDAQATANSHKYYWKVYINDGTYNVSNWYSFTTLASAPTNNITISNPYPANASTGIALTPKCNITISQSAGKNMTLYWYENSTGSYILRQTNGSTNWYNGNWRYRKLITIDRTKVPTTLTNFPVYVYMATDTDLGADAQNDGDDITFVLYSTNTTKLDHEIEWFDGGTGKLSAWVEIPTLSSTTDTKVWMYYGNPTCTSQQNKNGVWDSNFGAVWHMQEIDSIDSTSNGNTGSDTGTPLIGAGVVNNSVDFVPTDYVSVGTGASINTANDNTLTWECWINGDSNAVDQVFLEQSQGTNSWNVVLSTYDTDVVTNAIKFITRDDDGTGRDTLTSGVAITTGSWMYVVGTYNNGASDNKSIYINGVWKASTSVGVNNLRGGPITATHFGYGGDFGPYDGKIDEVRMSSTVRNASWITATYNTIATPSTFTSLGSEQAMVPNGTYRWTFTQASASSTKYYWKVLVNDTYHSLSSWYSFTTATGGVSRAWKSLLTSTGTGGNASARFRQLLSLSGTGGNATSRFRSLLSLSGTGGNATARFCQLFSLSGTGGNASRFRSLFSLSGTGGNGTARFRQLLSISGTGGNNTIPWHSLLSLSGTGGNATARFRYLFNISGTGGNVSVSLWRSIFSSSGTGGNGTARFKSLFSLSGTGGNNTVPWRSLLSLSGTGGNVSNRTWKPILNISGTGGNGSIPFRSLFLVSGTGGNISISVWNELLNLSGTGGDVSNFTSLFSLSGTGGNITGNRSLFSLSGTGGDITGFRSLFSLSGTGGNTSTVAPATPYNMNLLVINPNPGNGTHLTNYLESNTSGLTTSIDIFYENFTTPPAMIPGSYNITIVGTTPATTPVLWNTSAVYNTVWGTHNGVITPGNVEVGQWLQTGTYGIVRSFLMFDTSILPDNAIVNSGYISLVVYGDYSNDDFDVTVQICKPPYFHIPLVIGDFWEFPYADDVGNLNTTGYNNEDYFNITLNATGLDTTTGDSIKLDGTTKWALRSNQDIMASVPVDYEFMQFYGYGVETAKYPKLILNYTIPASNWQHIVNVTWEGRDSTVPWSTYAFSHVTVNGTATVPAINFSGIDTYYWHLEWESNKTNNGSSQIFTFTTVAGGGTGGGPSLIITQNDWARLLLVGVLVSLIIMLIVNRKRRRPES